MQAIDVAKLFAITLFLSLCSIAIYGEDVEGIPGLILSQIVKRAYSINGMTIGNYYDFFVNSHHPYTYYSHLGPIGWIIEYPYGQFGIGQIVGHFQIGLYTYDMSAGFWSTDGIAAAGHIGIIVIGILLGLLLAFFNFLVSRDSLRLLCLSSLGCIWMLADTSVFRVILSGAWPIHFVLIYLYLRGIRIESVKQMLVVRPSRATPANAPSELAGRAG